MIKIGMIGTNFVSDWMMEAVSQVDGISVDAICSRTMERGREFANKYGVKKVYDQYIDMAQDEELDAVYIASPTFCHFDHAMLMMEHGKHIFCEKPVCSNQKEVDILIRTAKEKGLVFMEAMKNVHQPGYKAIKENLYKIGPVRFASIAYCQYSSRYDNFKNGIIQNAFRTELSNGSTMDVGSYCAHFMAGIFGAPKSIVSNTVKLSNGCDGAGMAIAEYDGALVHLMYSKITDGVLPTQIQGEKGSMIIDCCPVVNKVTIQYRNGEVEELVFENEGHPLSYEVRDFKKLVEEKHVDHEFLECSSIEMQITDAIRKQNGIIFPAD